MSGGGDEMREGGDKDAKNMLSITQLVSMSGSEHRSEAAVPSAEFGRGKVGFIDELRRLQREASEVLTKVIQSSKERSTTVDMEVDLEELGEEDEAEGGGQRVLGWSAGALAGEQGLVSRWTRARGQH